MISSERNYVIQTEFDKLKNKYNPQCSQDLIIIATEEYGVANVVRTPIVKCAHEYGSIVRLGRHQKESRFIFYYTMFRWFEPLVLGHEIGHLSLNHRNSSLGRQVKEYEADYFSAILNGLSLYRFQTYRTVHTLTQNALDFKPFSFEDELERLVELGIPKEVVVTAATRIEDRILS